MINYLCENYDICLHGEYKEGFNLIVDNDQTVGIDCLTWLNSNYRAKIYNKFVCQITSPGIIYKLEIIL